MASDKKRRKAAKQVRDQQRPAAGPFRHPDGDRRRRGGSDVKQAYKNKELLQMIGLPPPADDAEE
jgi:hypothetical protein